MKDNSEQPPDPLVDRLACALKRELNVWTETDSRILEVTKGTWLRARVECRLALEDLRTAIRNEYQRTAIVLGKWLLALWRRKKP
jgi:hypothetical protein